MLKQRIITALVLVAVTVWALFYSSDMAWKLVLLIVGLIAAWEWAGFAKLELPALKLIYAFFVVVIANFAADVLTDQHLIVLTVLEALILLAVVHRYQFTKGMVGTKSNNFILLTGAIAIGLFITALLKFRAEFGALTLFFSLALVWAIDTGAYFSGRRFGKNKLAVHVSPGKTWEGVIGGGLFSFIFALSVLSYLSVSLAVPMFVFAAALGAIALFSVYGDLFESVMKRQVGLKDSGKILPGHGGVLDRIDSLLIAVPMLYLAWHFAVK